MNIKYLSDGKKVAVLGSLNSKEFIVQEVFVTASGAEIPSGENFVVKSLHDEPVVSWQEKNAKEQASRLKQLEAVTEKCRKELSQEQDKLRARIEALRAAAKSVGKLLEADIYEEYKTFINGEYKFQVNRYNLTYAPFDAFDRSAECEDSWSHRFEGYRLITLFGDGKDCRWGRSQYKDSSGYSEPLLLFRTEAEAVEYLRSYIEESDYRIDSLSFLLDHALPIDKSKAAKLFVTEFAYLEKREVDMLLQQAELSRSRDKLKKMKKAVEEKELEG